jgi:hypothetical protein
MEKSSQIAWKFVPLRRLDTISRIRLSRLSKFSCIMTPIPATLEVPRFLPAGILRPGRIPRNRRARLPCQIRRVLRSRTRREAGGDCTHQLNAVPCWSPNICGSSPPENRSIPSASYKRHCKIQIVVVQFRDGDGFPGRCGRRGFETVPGVELS